MDMFLSGRRSYRTKRTKTFLTRPNSKKRGPNPYLQNRNDMKLHKYIAAVIFMGLGTVMSQSQDTIPEVEALLQKMTLEEKIGQLNLLTPGGGVATGSVVSDDVEGKIKVGEVGGIFGVTSPERVRLAQDLAVKSSRLG